MKGVLVGEGAGAAEGGEVQGAVVGRGEFAEDEEFDEEEEDEGDGELAEEEALREGETGCRLVECMESGGRGMERWATYVVPWGAGSGDTVGSCAMIKKNQLGDLIAIFSWLCSCALPFAGSTSRCWESWMMRNGKRQGFGASRYR